MNILRHRNLESQVVKLLVSSNKICKMDTFRITVKFIEDATYYFNYS